MRPPVPSGPPPTRVVVDHILIGVTNPRMAVRRSIQEAHDIAYDLLEKIQAGADFQELKRKHSDDPPPGGPYTMLDGNQRANPQQAIFLRSMMAKAFGDVGFSLAVGDVWIADYDPTTSPFGFHIIKRIE